MCKTLIALKQLYYYLGGFIQGLCSLLITVIRITTNYTQEPRLTVLITDRFYLI